MQPRPATLHWVYVTFDMGSILFEEPYLCVFLCTAIYYPETKKTETVHKRLWIFIWSGEMKRMRWKYTYRIVFSAAPSYWIKLFHIQIQIQL